MKKMFVVFAALVLACTINTDAQNLKKDNVQDYVERYRGLAMSEQQRTGIPAAIKLAQGIHETGAGTSKLATQANNHFGLKCKTDWTGQTFLHTDDRRNECFRKYNLDFESYQDHSNYLRNNPRYAALFQLSVTDYAGWAFGLRKAGYATNPQYSQLLIKIIEDYHLQEYTYAAMGSDPASNVASAPAGSDYNQPRGRNNQYAQQQPADNYAAQNSYGNQGYTPQANNYAAQQPVNAVQPERVSKYIDTRPAERQTVVRSRQGGRNVETVVDNAPQNVVKINNLKAVYGKAGDMPLQYAVRNGIRYEKFLEMNDLEEKPLPTDMPLYLERKHFWGIRPMHLVKPGETMLVIAQKEGIQLKYLRELNYMEEGEEPMPGVTLELQAQAAGKPAARPHTPEDDGRFAQNTYNNNNYESGNESYDGYGEDPEVNNPRYYDPSAAQQAPPTRTFPKNPAPEYKEEKNVFEKIKEAREIRKREQQIQASLAQQKQATQQPPQQPVQQSQQFEPNNSRQESSRFIPSADQQPAYTQQAETYQNQQNTTDTRNNYKPNPAAQHYNNNARPQQGNTSYGNTPSQNTYGAQSTTPEYQQPQQTQQSYQQPQYNNTTVKPNPAAQVAEGDDKREKRRNRRKGKDDEVTQPVATQPQPQKPKTELDLLKEQFDNVIYAGNDSRQQNNQQPQQRQQNQQSYQQPQQQVQQQQPYNNQQSYGQQSYGQQQSYNNQQPYTQQQEQAPQQYQQQGYGQQQPQTNQPQAQRQDPGKYYTVKRGDTAYTIAKKNGITIRQLMDWNGLDFDAIKEGQNLRVKP